MAPDVIPSGGAFDVDGSVQRVWRLPPAVEMTPAGRIVGLRCSALLAQRDSRFVDKDNRAGLRKTSAVFGRWAQTVRTRSVPRPRPHRYGCGRALSVGGRGWGLGRRRTGLGWLDARRMAWSRPSTGRGGRSHLLQRPRPRLLRNAVGQASSVMLKQRAGGNAELFSEGMAEVRKVREAAVQRCL